MKWNIQVFGNIKHNLLINVSLFVAKILWKLPCVSCIKIMVSYVTEWYKLERNGRAMERGSWASISSSREGRRWTGSSWEVVLKKWNGGSIKNRLTANIYWGLTPLGVGPSLHIHTSFHLKTTPGCNLFCYCYTTSATNNSSYDLLSDYYISRTLLGTYVCSYSFSPHDNLFN